jgi:hypothetical protein
MARGGRKKSAPVMVSQRGAQGGGENFDRRFDGASTAYRRDTAPL